MVLISRALFCLVMKFRQIQFVEWALALLLSICMSSLTAWGGSWFGWDDRHALNPVPKGSVYMYVCGICMYVVYVCLCTNTHTTCLKDGGAPCISHSSERGVTAYMREFRIKRESNHEPFSIVSFKHQVEGGGWRKTVWFYTSQYPGGTVAPRRNRAVVKSTEPCNTLRSKLTCTGTNPRST